MKRKTVQTKYDVPVRQAFRWASEQQSCSAEASMIVRIPAPWLTKEIIFVCTVFLSFTLWMTCERTLIHAGQRYELHHRICNLRYGTHGYRMNSLTICKVHQFIVVSRTYVCYTISSATIHGRRLVLTPEDCDL